MKSFTFISIIFFSIIFYFFNAPIADSAACANIPISGNATITAHCAFSGDVNGVEQGNLIISGTDCGSPPGPCTLTINSGQIIAFNPGQRVTVNGRLAIEKGGRLSVGYIWYLDADNDNFPDNFNATSSRESPGSNYWRRSDSHFTTPYSACGVATVEAMTCGGGRWLNNESCETTNVGYYSPKCNNLQTACTTCKWSAAGAESCSNVAAGQDPGNHCSAETCPVVQNNAAGRCNDLCAAQAQRQDGLCDGAGACRKKSCICSSVGLNSPPNNGHYRHGYEYYGTQCTTYSGIGCATSLGSTGHYCESRLTNYTNCNCVRN